VSPEPFLITPENLPAYLQNRGLISDTRRWVVKQSLGKLRVQDDWRSGRLAKYNRLLRIEAELGAHALNRGAEVLRGFL